MQKFQILSIDKANLTLSLLQIWNHRAFPNTLYKQLNRDMNYTSFCSGGHIYQLTASENTILAYPYGYLCNWMNMTYPTCTTCEVTQQVHISLNSFITKVAQTHSPFSEQNLLLFWYCSSFNTCMITLNGRAECTDVLWSYLTNL